MGRDPAIELRLLLVAEREDSVIAFGIGGYAVSEFLDELESLGDG